MEKCLSQFAYTNILTIQNLVQRPLDLLLVSLAHYKFKPKKFISVLSEFQIVEVLLHGNKSLDILSNNSILNVTIDFLFETRRFEERLFSSNNQCKHGF